MTKQPDVDLFRPSVIQQSALKGAIFGPQGSGKSTTAALIAIGLAKAAGDGKAVFMHDTENGSDFLRPIFTTENVPFMVRKSRSFPEMCAGLREAARRNAVVYIEDSITTDWNTMLDDFRNSFSPPINKIELYHWARIKPDWQNQWVVPMLNSPIHVIACGREGLVYEEVARSDGQTESAVTGVKIKAEGEFGYEPNLLVQIETSHMVEVGRKLRKGTLRHRATVIKDRTRSIQGAVFEWPDLTRYEIGDYRKVFDKFRPHLEFLSGSETQAAVEPSALPSAFRNGHGEWSKEQKERAAWLEEVQGTMTLLWPGQDAASKRIKLLVLERLFSTRSWSRVENDATLGVLESAAAQLRTVEKLVDRTVLGEEEAVMQAFADAGQRAAKEAAALYQQ